MIYATLFARPFVLLNICDSRTMLVPPPSLFTAHVCCLLETLKRKFRLWPTLLVRPLINNIDLCCSFIWFRIQILQISTWFNYCIVKVYFLKRTIALQTTNSYSDKNNAFTNPRGFALKGKRAPELGVSLQRVAGG